MKIKKVKVDTVGLEDYEPTKHPRVFLNIRENTVCVVGRQIAIEIELSSGAQKLSV